MNFRSVTLDNGLEVIAECNDAAYSIALGFFVRAGSRDETEDVAGVSHFLEHMAFKGSDTRTAEQINREFDDLGARSNAFTSEEQTVYYASLLPELQEPAVALLADLLRPAFRPDEFETEKEVILEEIRMYEDQPPFGADEKCREIFFHGHPLAQNILGTPESIMGITPEKMRRYFECRYSPENIVLVGCGKIDFDAFVRQAEQETRTWRPASDHAFPRRLERVRGQGAGSLHLIHKRNVMQQYVLQLVDGPPGDDLDRFPAALLANMLGDDVGSKLYWALLDPGLADSVSLSAYEYTDNGFFMTGLCCSADSAKSNVAIIEEIYDNASKSGLEEQDLVRTKNKLLSRIVLASERPRGRLFGIGNDWLTRREYRSIRDDLNTVEAITLHDIHRVLEQYPLDTPLTVLVGPLDTW